MSQQYLTNSQGGDNSDEKGEGQSKGGKRKSPVNMLHFVEGLVQYVPGMHWY